MVREHPPECACVCVRVCDSQQGQCVGERSQSFCSAPTRAVTQADPLQRRYELRWSGCGAQALLCAHCSRITGYQHLPLINVDGILSTVSVLLRCCSAAALRFINYKLDCWRERHAFHQTAYWHFYGQDFVSLMVFPFFKGWRAF